MTDPSPADLNRCPHGRHRGDVCAGHRGPGIFDGGCQGGVSLGNPWPEDGGTRIGTTISGHPILDTDLPTDGRPRWVRSRFHADPTDPRPVTWPPPGPLWLSGTGDDHATAIVWHRPDQAITGWWPEATHIETEEGPVIRFASRFPRPAWWISAEETE